MVHVVDDARVERGALARSVLVGAVCGLGAVFAHAAGGDGHLDAAASASVLAGGMAAGPLLVRRPSLPMLFAATAGLQLVAHAVMAMTMSGSMGQHATSVPGSRLEAWLGALSDGGAVMAGAHLAIALVTAAMARGADQALLSLLRERLHAVLAPAPPASLVPSGRRLATPRLSVQPLRPRRGRRPSKPRGPPRAAQVLAPSA